MVREDTSLDLEALRRSSACRNPILNLVKCQLPSANLDQVRNGALRCVSEIEDLAVFDAQPYQSATNKAKERMITLWVIISYNQGEVFLSM